MSVPAAESKNKSSLLHYQLQQAQGFLNSQVIGMNSVIELSLAASLARTHVLLEGVPGVGKTSLARAMAQAFGGKFSRVQMTSDMLPSDVIGVLRPRLKDDSFEFRPGPIFANFVLADELNRCNPRTQSALLECMSEPAISVDGQSYPLPKPFFLMATQNPEESIGVYPLSESQLDRFALNLLIEFPNSKDETQLYVDRLRAQTLTSGFEGLGVDYFSKASNEIAKVHTDDSFVKFLQEVVAKTRSHADLRHGLSVRAGIQWIELAKSLAWVRHREHVLWQDYRDLAPSLMAHRLGFREDSMPLRSKRAWVDEFFKSQKSPY